ncbi:SDR family mycofactocin-dependent oxidoreductase [Amycolatopsis sp. GM8]|uniref:SDR family mycofactocin-dependent oxidoreductase n=1 Tax=Amycolatopsis sp. GM8 TaxID=2896530 RepID=UPI001F28DDA1|nr:SDR family mycofactocin-dependent oxidoreductase [Amycolatopsis sp. GM8]
MAGQLEGQVAFITGAARGQGRAHCERLAEEGCDIIGVDICKDVPTIDYPLGTADELAQTVKLVEKRGRRMVAQQADVRDPENLRAAFQAGYDVFKRVDIAIANAGAIRVGPELQPNLEFADVTDTIINGAFHTIRAVLPEMKQGGQGGSIVLVSSSAALKPTGSEVAAHVAYNAGKMALIAIAKTYAAILGKHRIRVNTIHPTGVATGMTMNAAMETALNDGSALATMQNALPVKMLQAEDVANRVARLVSAEEYYNTGATIELDAGFSVL